jgi:hypothetical protein
LEGHDPLLPAASRARASCCACARLVGGPRDQGKLLLLLLLLLLAGLDRGAILLVWLFHRIRRWRRHGYRHVLGLVLLLLRGRQSCARVLSLFWLLACLVQVLVARGRRCSCWHVVGHIGWHGVDGGDGLLHHLELVLLRGGKGGGDACGSW